MLKSYKCRLYPTAKQEVLLNKHFGACRFIYNLGLEVKKNAWDTHRKNVSVYDLMKQLTDLKKEYIWLNEISRDALNQSLFVLDKSYYSFFKGNGFPKFKNKKSKNSFKNPNPDDIKIKGNRLCIPKFSEGISMIISENVKGQIKNSTVTKSATGKYFVSILCETGELISDKSPIKEQTTVGVDLGLKDFAVTSNVEKFNNPKYYKRSLLKLKFLSRQLSKKKGGSKNRNKSKHKLSLQHEYIANQRKDFLHKLSAQLIKNHDTLCFEKLNIEGMIKNRKLSQAIGDAGWSEFKLLCKYKAEWYGKNILEVDTFFPSSKLCSNCGSKNETLTLKDREWPCVNCGVLHDRDINAAINIKNHCLNNYCGETHRKKSIELPVVIRSVEIESTSLRIC